MRTLSALCLALVLGVTSLTALPQKAQASQTPAADVQPAVVYVRGPYFTYAAASYVADVLYAQGYSTSIVYRAGYYYVVYG